MGQFPLVGPSVPNQAAADDSLRLFREEYERINAALYENRLPPFPGVELVDRTDIFSLTRTFGEGALRRLAPFVLSKHVRGPLLLEAIRHEIAHAAAIFFDQHEGHGPEWQLHARRAGARGDATLDPGHPLRSSWPSS
jgi:hypothetical protein